MVGTASRPSFVLLFVAGVLSTAAFAALTFILVFSWHHCRGGHKVEPSDNEIPLPALEEGHTAPDALDFSCRGPSRLGGISPLSAERPGETPSVQSQFQAQPPTDKGSQDDIQHPHPDASQTFDYIVNPVTPERSDPAGDQTERAERISNITTAIMMTLSPTFRDRGYWFSPHHQRCPLRHQFPAVDSLYPQCGVKRVCGQIFRCLLLHTYQSNAHSGFQIS